MQFDANKEESEKEESVKVESEKEQCSSALDRLKAANPGVVECRICKEDHWTKRILLVLSGSFSLDLWRVRKDLTEMQREAQQLLQPQQEELVLDGSMSHQARGEETTPLPSPGSAGTACPIRGGRTPPPSGSATCQRMPRKRTCRYGFLSPSPF